MEPPVLLDMSPVSAQGQHHDHQAKVKKDVLIKIAIANRDVDTLCRLAKSKGGLVSDSLRRQAWPILLGCNADKKLFDDYDGMQPHTDEDQVRLDVDRAFIFYPPDLSENELKVKREELFRVITHVLRRNVNLSYFQGFHDVCQVFYLLFGPRRAIVVVEHVALHRLRDFMMPVLQPSLTHLHLIPQIVALFDPALATQLRFTKPYYALSAMLTMFAHDIENLDDLTIVWDFFFAADDATAPAYLYAAMLLSCRRQEIFQFAPRDAEMIHAVLSRSPQPPWPGSTGLTDVIGLAEALHVQHMPQELPIWRSEVSKFSVLKTWTRPEQSQQQQQNHHYYHHHYHDDHQKLRKRKSDKKKPATMTTSEVYIELDEVNEKGSAAHVEMERLIEDQIADTERRLAEEKIQQQEILRKRKELSERTKRLAKSPSQLAREKTRSSLRDYEKNGKLTPQQGKKLLTKESDPVTAIPNPEFYGSMAHHVLHLTLGVSIVVGIFGVWVTWMYRT
ncbi:rab-GTPase-TBC domain-containing protein [Lipomyces japonicus]|uniref:rab-GTPase-TBC domain-containing protein n=1 Tax=Lipomyces japonicus TaxID=56871 RepID=UPI0034CD66BD